MTDGADAALYACGVSQRPAAPPTNAVMPELCTFEVFLQPAQVAEQPVGCFERGSILAHPFFAFAQLHREVCVYIPHISEALAVQHADEIHARVLGALDFESHVLPAGLALYGKEGVSAVKEARRVVDA